MNSILKKARRDYSLTGLTLAGVFLLTQGSIYLLYFLFDGSFSSIFGGLLSESEASILLSSLIMYLVFIPIALLLFRIAPSSQLQQQSIGKDFLPWLLICFPVMNAGALIGNILSSLLSFGGAKNPVEAVGSMHLWLEILCTVILAPIFEELLFRRAIIKRCVKYGEIPAIIFSAVAFGLFHGNLYQFFYAFGIGLVFGYVYARTGKIRYTILMHAIINFWGSIAAKYVIDYQSIIIAFESGSYLYGSFRVFLTLNYMMIQVTAIVFGIIFLVRRIRKLYFQPVPSIVPTGSVLRNSFINVGVIIFSVLFTAEIVLHLVP